VTDAPSRPDSPENEDGQPSAEHAQGTQKTQDAPDRQDAQGPQDTPQWSADQPAPAPWYLGQPGAVPPPPAPAPGWPQPPAQPLPPMPPPTADQANWPEHAPGTRPGQQPQPGQGEGQSHGQGQNGAPADAVPPWTGQAPPNPERPGAGTDPGGRPGPQQPAPWHDPNRYSQPGSRPPQQDPRSPYRPQQPSRREEPGERPPLSLRTRWARGLAIGGALCTLITLLNGYRNFPAWLIGAAAGLAMSLAALWLGVFAQRDAARKQQRAPEAVASVVWSGISTLIALGVVAMSLIFYPQLREYSDCMRAANTVAGQNACQQQLNNSLTFKP
jgi:hypothetical protein